MYLKVAVASDSELVGVRHRSGAGPVSGRRGERGLCARAAPAVTPPGRAPGGCRTPVRCGESSGSRRAAAGACRVTLTLLGRLLSP